MVVVAPVILQRVCDASRSTMDASEIVRYGAELVQKHGEAFMLAHPYFPGCGIAFQWYWGSGCCCPECGRLYMVKFEEYKSGVYTPKTI